MARDVGIYDYRGQVFVDGMAEWSSADGMRCSGRGRMCQMGGGRYFAGTQVARPGLR